MANERHTERLVEESMNLFDGSFECYSQSDYNQRDYLLTELLGPAGGKPPQQDIFNLTNEEHTGIASPEFLIKYSNDTYFVIECKNNVKNHASGDLDDIISLDKPKQYAVDGALYYAKWLHQKLNVVIVAVSGDKDNWYSTTYYWKKDEELPYRVKELNDQIDKPEYMYKVITGEEISRSFSLEEIREVAQSINVRLRDIKISEKNKPIFVAGILIGLMDDGFSELFKNTDKYSQLKNLLLAAIDDVLDKSDIPKKKIKSIKNTFAITMENEKLSAIPLGTTGSLDWYINELKHKIVPMMNYNTSVDALGVFYHEFIRYTGGDGKGLGIVLTPTHITDFMCELARVNKNSRVLDPCCGSAGFLVTAMSKMWKNANDQEKERIKKHQLYGIELDTELYILAITNMIIRGDGKSNIYCNDCMKKEMFEEIKGTPIYDGKEIVGYEGGKGINVGLINPPYSQKDTSELEFVNNMLNMMETGGIGVAIVPLSCAIGTKFGEIRKELMKKHTLKAVFTMPDQLFYPTATNTCIMVWEAYRPHDENVPTFLGRYVDDGYVLQKPYGRIDRDSKWEEIKEKWLKDYFEMKTDDYNTIMVNLNPDKEWLAEAYIKTDYSNLTDKDFEQTVRDYIAYEVKNGI